MGELYLVGIDDFNEEHEQLQRALLADAVMKRNKVVGVADVIRSEKAERNFLKRCGGFSQTECNNAYVYGLEDDFAYHYAIFTDIYEKFLTGNEADALKLQFFYELRESALLQECWQEAVQGENSDSFAAFVTAVEEFQKQNKEIKMYFYMNKLQKKLRDKPWNDPLCWLSLLERFLQQMRKRHTGEENLVFVRQEAILQHVGDLLQIGEEKNLPVYVLLPLAELEVLEEKLKNRYNTVVVKHA